MFCEQNKAVASSSSGLLCSRGKPQENFASISAK